MAEKTGARQQGCLVDLSCGRTNPFRIKLKNRCPVIILEITRLHIGQRTIILPCQFPILLLVYQQEFYFSFQIIHKLRVFMVAGNLSRNTNVVKKESIVSKQPKDQEEIIWANERSRQSAPAIPKYEYGLCRYYVRSFSRHRARHPNCLPSGGRGKGHHRCARYARCGRFAVPKHNLLHSLYSEG